MPYQIDFEERGVYVRIQGVVTRDLIDEAVNIIWGHPSWSRAEYELWNYSDISGVRIDNDYVVEVAFQDNAASLTSERSKIAVVTDNDTLIAMTEHYRNWMNRFGVDVRWFAVLDEARAWLATS